MDETNIRMHVISPKKLFLSLVVKRGEDNELVVKSVMPSLSEEDKD